MCWFGSNCEVADGGMIGARGADGIIPLQIQCSQQLLRLEPMKVGPMDIRSFGCKIQTNGKIAPVLRDFLRTSKGCK